MASAFGHEMSDEREQMSQGSSIHVRVAARPFQDRDLESVRAVTEPELNSQKSSSFPRECCARFRQLAKSRQSKLSQIQKNHLFRIGPITATEESFQNFERSADAQDSEES